MCVRVYRSLLSFCQLIKAVGGVLKVRLHKMFDTNTPTMCRQRKQIQIAPQIQEYHRLSYKIVFRYFLQKFTELNVLI